MIFKYILSLTLVVGGLAAPKIVFNEVIMTGAHQLECVVLDSSYPTVGYYFIDKNLNTIRVSRIIAGKVVGQMGYKTLPSPLPVDPMLIVLYEEPSAHVVTPFALMDKAKIYDSIVISTNGNDPTAFTSKLPEWDNRFLQFDTSSSLSRCFSQDSHVPDYWFERPPTPLAMNDCPPVDPVTDGDPHFAQKVLDRRSKNIVNICYDVTGRSGQLISILSDNSTMTTVRGVLKDDYYMHEIRIQYKAGLIVVGQSSILVNDEKLEWVDSSEYKFDFVTIRMAKRTVFVESFYQNSKLTTVVEKGFRKYSGSYLNVFFKNIDIFYKGYGGLLGDIGRKSYAITDGIQLNHKTVQADDDFLSGRVAKRFPNECILLPVKGLLSPKTIDDYVY